MKRELKKTNTNYVVNIWEWESRDDIRITVNEEVKDHIKVEWYDQRRKSKKDHIKYFKWVVKILENL